MSAKGEGTTSGDQSSLKPGILKSKFKKKIHSKPKMNNISAATTISFKGDTEDIKAILSLNREITTEGDDGFTNFQKQLETYVLREYDNPKDLMPLILKLVNPVFSFDKNNKPVNKFTKQELEDNPVEKQIMEDSVRIYSKRKQNLQNNVVTLWGHIWGQCTPSLRAELEADSDFDDARTKYDSLWLLTTCKKIIASIDRRGNKYYNAYQVIMDFNNLRQKKNESPQQWLKRYQAAVETIYLAQCDHIFYSKDISKLPNEDPTSITLEKKKMEAMYFLLHSDASKFRSLKDEYYTDMIKGKDSYPISTIAVYDAMLQWSEKPGSQQTHQTTPLDDNAPTTRVSYTMVRLVSGKEVEVDQNVKCPGVSGHVIDRPCFHCGKWGHVMSDCPDMTESERRSAVKERAAAKRATSHLHVRFCGIQNTNDLVHPNYIMLDSCSESSVIMNKALVHEVSKCPVQDQLLLITNGGSMKFEEKGTLNLFPMSVHFNPNSMANILSLKEVGDLDGVHIKMDTSQERAIHVHIARSGLTYIFIEGKLGLYYFDTTKPDKHIRRSVNAYSFLSTVSENKSHFTSNQIKGATMARQLQEYIGWPSVNNLKKYINSNTIRNCPVTSDDVTRAEYIFGPALPLLQGKTTNTSARFRAPPAVLPSPILDFHKVTELFIDFLYVNKMPFIHTKSKDINFLTIQHHGSRKITGVIKGLQQIIQMYTRRGFEVTTIHGDNEFNVRALIEAIRPALMQIYARNEHVGVIERSIRTLKERCRCICHSLPYKKFTKIMTTALLENVVSWLNTFPANDGISTTLSPSAIVVGRPNLDMNQPMIEFGAYAAVHNGTTNTMKGRITPAIALNRSNDKGGYYFMSLETGKRIHGFIWTTKPINPQVINRVHALATYEKQPKLVNNCPIFEWSPGLPIDDEDVGEEYQDDSDEESNADEINNEYVEDQDDTDHEEDEQDANDDSMEIIPNDHEIHDDIDVEDDINDPELQDDGDQISQTKNEESDDQDNNDIIVEDAYDLEDEDSINERTFDGEVQDMFPPVAEQNKNDIQENDDSNATNQNIPQDDVRRSNRANAGKGVNRLQMDFKGKKYWSFMMKKALIRNGMKGVKLRSVQARSYLMKKSVQHNRDTNYMHMVTRVLFMQQMSASKGIDKFGEKAIAALFKEFKQLNDGPMPGKPVIIPLALDDLTETVKNQAMNAINLIGQKDCGKIKGRSCADGRKQKRYLKEDENVSSPTASLEAINATWIIDAFEGRDVVTSDVPGAYLHATMPEDKFVTMKFKGKQIIDIMCDVNPEYKDYTIEEKGQQVLYVRVLRAIYGSIYSGLLWYDLFTNTLKDMGFELNPYDQCVANKMVNGKQCTIVWYVDDLKVSHMEHDVNMEVIDTLRQHFGDLKATTGDKHTYLGVNYTIDRKKKVVKMEAKRQVQEAIDKFPQDSLREIQSPAGQGLFNVDEELQPLPEDKADLFHSIVAKLLWLEKRVRPDIEPTISFLTTRVSEPNTSDWEKLARLINYLHTTIDDDRIMGADSLDTLYTWIDAAYAVHPNMRSHTGGCMSMGTGTMHARSSKQKLNTKSSTEAEVVGLSEYIPYSIWLVYFLQEQGFHLTTNHIHQDNQSAIKMETNGRKSCTGNSRHINIRYFFVKDRIDKGEFSIGFCPTTSMLADFFTKPLNGALFKKFKAVIMGHAHISTLLSPSKERVENSTICEKENIPNIVDDENNGNVTAENTVNTGLSYLQALTNGIVIGKESKDSLTIVG